jgi:hypothetical protein
MKRLLIYVFLIILFVIAIYILFQRDCSWSEHYPKEKLTLDQYRYQLYQQLSIKTLKSLCYYDEDKPYCFPTPQNLEQFRKSIKIVAKDAIMHGIRNKDYYYLILLILKINSMEMNFLGYEDCLYFYSNAYGTAIVTSFLNRKDSLRKLTLIRVSDLFKIFENDCFRLKNDKEIDDKIKELGYTGEDSENYKVFYKTIVFPLFENQEFKDNMINNQTEDMPLELFAKYGTAVYLSNYLFNQTKDECIKEK